MRKMFLHVKGGGKFIAALLLGVFINCISGKAQNVTVSEKTGSMICSQTSYEGGSTETGFGAGGFATWKHFQLPLTMTVSDLTDLSPNGQLAVHANNLYNAGVDKGIQLFGGTIRDGYMTLALPKGYRFTGYKIIVQNNVSTFGHGSKALNIQHTHNFYFGETTSAFDFKAGFYCDLQKNVSNTEYTVERTSMTPGDMGNILYFKIANHPTTHIRGHYVGVTLKYVELTFTPEAPFKISVAPQKEDQTGASVVQCAFATGKVDLGRISQNTYTGVTRQSYVYREVKDLLAWALFYEKASVDQNLPLDNRSAGSAMGNRSIKSVKSGQNYYFEIQPGQTYFAETPIGTVDQQQNEVPLHYRITAAKVNYAPNPGIPVRPYTLKVYDKTGKNATEINVTEAGSFNLTGMNNDAVKLEVVGGAGLVNLELTLEALDPYINHMELMCNHGDVRISREFVSSDFSVGGGVFYFYIPRDWLNTACNFTFENLKSKYADNTYHDGTTHGNARYSFVKSEYYNLFGNSNNNIYSHPDYAADYDYTKKVYVATAGTKAFKFNNADEVSKMAIATSLKEYPFTLEAYSAAGGTFTNVTMTPTEENKDYKTNAFVFTTDETRYNIAPTTATQHRYYAYYDMEIHLVARTYTPSVTFERVYDNSFYGNEENGAFYGATITSQDADGNLGYSSIEAVKQQLELAIAAGGSNVPAAMDRLLYVDMGRKMQGTYSTNADSWDALKNALAKNALIFLPKNTTHADDNFAYAEEGGTYKASRNIILTDKQPFYSPYKIRVDAANYARYVRELSGKNGQAKKATLMLPFTLALTDGKHVNRGDDCSFEVYTMQPDNCLSVSPEQKEGYDYMKFDGEAHFVKVTGLTTEANKPYMVLVSDEYVPKDGQSFVALQYGADILPTTEHKNRVYLAGEKAKGTGNGTNYVFENRGTYCGAQVQQVFYFANNKYYSSLNLASDPKQVNIRPFRSYYSFASSSGAKMATFNVVFGENGETTGINSVKAHADLAVTTTNGMITICAKRTQRVEIFGVNGMSVAKLNLKANETKRVAVASGVYVINGVKVSVQ
ncbi:hypothetical protein [Hoylesella loescheii]|uniref:hypothetical protein n=1 Tax=Hoylesella loescheii TaxID=840 RepID=UPI0028ECA57C|nr:hypothetical protein [Hoylesella loescheii]